MFQSEVWKNAHIANPNIAGPESRGWKMEDDRLQIVWYEGRCLPDELVDIIADAPSSLNLQDEDDDSDNDVDIVNISDDISEDLFDT